MTLSFVVMSKSDVEFEMWGSVDYAVSLCSTTPLPEKREMCTISSPSSSKTTYNIYAGSISDGCHVLTSRDRVAVLRCGGSSRIC